MLFDSRRSHGNSYGIVTNVGDSINLVFTSRLQGQGSSEVLGTLKAIVEKEGTGKLFSGKFIYITYSVKIFKFGRALYNY